VTSFHGALPKLAESDRSSWSAAVRIFTARRLAAYACQAVTNDGRKHAVAMTLQTTVARPSSAIRAIAELTKLAKHRRASFPVGVSRW
jgi:hypothetical protein